MSGRPSGLVYIFRDPAIGPVVTLLGLVWTVIRVRAPGLSEVLARKVVTAVNRLRDLDLAKPPGVAETLDWVATLDVLGATELDAGTAEDTLGAVVKERDDLELVRDNLEEIVSGA